MLLHVRPEGNNTGSYTGVPGRATDGASCAVRKPAFGLESGDLSGLEETVRGPGYPGTCPFRRSVKTTMIYTHVLNRGGIGIRSPLDTILDPGRDLDQDRKRPKSQRDPSVPDDEEPPTK